MFQATKLIEASLDFLSICLPTLSFRITFFFGCIKHYFELSIENDGYMSFILRFQLCILTGHQINKRKTVGQTSRSFVDLGYPQCFVEQISP